MADSTPALTKRFMAALPTKLTIASGDAIEFGIYDADGPLEPDGSEPAIKVRPVSAAPVRQLENRPPVEVTASQTDTITFTAGTDVYQVTERDIDAITSLTATVGGTSGTTLTEGTDYEKHSTDDYVTDDAVRFLDGGTKPDDGTTFDVTYDHRFARFDAEVTWNIIWRLAVRVPQLASGEHGATAEYRASWRVANQAQDHLARILRGKQGTNLWAEGDGAPFPGSFSLHEVQALSMPGMGEEDTVADRFVDVRTSRVGITEGEKVEMLGSPRVSRSEVTMLDGATHTP